MSTVGHPTPRRLARISVLLCLVLLGATSLKISVLVVLPAPCMFTPSPSTARPACITSLCCPCERALAWQLWLTFGSANLATNFSWGYPSTAATRPTAPTTVLDRQGSAVPAAHLHVLPWLGLVLPTTRLLRVHCAAHGDVPARSRCAV